MLHVPNFEPGLDLRIHVRTTIRYNYSFIESAAIRIGDDTLEVVSFGGYALNGIGNADLEDAEANLAGYKITHSRPNDKEHVFAISIGPHETITISTFKDIVSVMIDDGGISNHYDASVGIMGSFVGGSMLARNGTVIMEDPHEFGQEWQVLSDEPMLFRTLRAPQFPQQKCRLPSSDGTKDARHLRRLGENSITREAAEKACAHLEAGSSKEACIFDGACVSYLVSCFAILRCILIWFILFSSSLCVLS